MAATTIVEAPPLASSGNASPRRDLLDVVIVLSDDHESKASLEAWIPVLSRYHVVAVCESPGGDIGLPDVEMHSIADAQRLIGQHLNSKCAALSYGALVARRKFVLLLDLQACAPIHGDPLEDHLSNLCSPSTPYFFNTLYDPFRPGSDFVRGYPFSLRLGVPTAVSHGLWVKKNGLSPKIVDAVLTVPRGALVAMSSVNVAFDRELVGVAVGSAISQGEVWLGFFAKAICDHLGYGVKSGLPYVALNESLGEEKPDQQLSDGVVEFFANLKLPASATTAEQCVLEIAKLGKGKLGAEFSSVAGSMEAWISAWKQSKNT